MTRSHKAKRKSSRPTHRVSRRTYTDQKYPIKGQPRLTMAESMKLNGGVTGRYRNWKPNLTRLNHERSAIILSVPKRDKPHDLGGPELRPLCERVTTP